MLLILLAKQAMKKEAIVTAALRNMFRFGVFCQFCITHLERKYTFETAMVLQSDLLPCKMHLMPGWLMKLLVGLDLFTDVTL